MIRKKQKKTRQNKLKFIPILLLAISPILSAPMTMVSSQPTISRAHILAPVPDTSLITSNDTAKIETNTNKHSQKKDSIKKELIKEIDNYIDKIAPKSKLNGRMVAQKCLEYEIEPAFVLAQSQIECHFGTAGSARRTNSAWNVGAWDTGYRGKYYSHPDESIEPYLKLLKESYLVNGKTIHHLMRNYVSAGGYRYASSTSYEAELKKTYNDIKRVTQINKLYTQLKELS